VELVRLWENQKLSLENVLRKQRASMKHMQKILTDSEAIHRKMAEELEEEKEKNASMKGSVVKELKLIYLKPCSCTSIAFAHF